MKKQFRNYKGEMVVAPDKLKYVVLESPCGTITLSRNGNLRPSLYRVNYALEVNDYSTLMEAMTGLGGAIYHRDQCEKHDH